MFCTSCGAKLIDGMRFCVECGAEIIPMEPVDEPTASEAKPDDPKPQATVVEPPAKEDVAKPEPVANSSEAARPLAARIKQAIPTAESKPVQAATAAQAPAWQPAKPQPLPNQPIAAEQPVPVRKSIPSAEPISSAFSEQTRTRPVESPVSGTRLPVAQIVAALAIAAMLACVFFIVLPALSGNQGATGSMVASGDVASSSVTTPTDGSGAPASTAAPAESGIQQQTTEGGSVQQGGINMNEGVTFIEINYNQAWIDSALLGLQGFSWLFSWGMYLFLIATLGILIWVFFDSISKHKDQQALVPRILSMVGLFLIFPAFIFRFTGNADGVHTLVRMNGEPGAPYYPGPINWNVNWLVRGYGPMIAIIALLGVIISIVALVVYASSVQRSRPSTEFVQAFNSQINSLERKVENVQNAQAATATRTPSASFASNASSNATIIDRKPQAATIIDLPKSGDTLAVQSGAGRGIVYDLPCEDVIAGRDAGNFIVVSDGKVSSRHCKLVFGGAGTWTVMDMGSTNGTYLNGQRINGQAPLADGDSIKIGDTVLVFRQGR